jgi:hypothetical protein
MNLVQAMLVGRGLVAFLSEWQAQDVKNKICKAKEQTEYTLQQIYDCAIFELAICAVDIQSGWQDAFERQCEYMRRYIFMGKLNPEKFSQRLQDMNKYMGYDIPIKRTTGADKTQKAYGKSYPDDEFRSIMGRAIPPEWTVNLLALDKEPWRFKDVDDQLDMYRQQWQEDQHNKIILKMSGKIPGKSNDKKEKEMKETIIITMVIAAAVARAIMANEGVEEAEEDVVEEAIAISII